MPGEKDVHLHRITEDVTLRMWGSGLEDLKIYCFDFLKADGTPINTPVEWEIHTVPDPDTFSLPPQQLHSIERAMGVKPADFDDGTTEKYTAPEGTRCKIVLKNSNGTLVNKFTIPSRNRSFT